MAVHHLQRLIAEGEHQMLDFKFEISDAPKIARTLVAFANSDGGRLLIGVKDNGMIAGVRSEEEFFMIESAAQLYCRPPVEFTFRDWSFNKKRVLEVIVARSPLRPHYAKNTDGTWIPYIRSGDQNFIANRILLNVWKRQTRPEGVKIRFTDPERLLLTLLEAEESVTHSGFAKRAGIKSNKAADILVKFVCLGMVRMHFTANGTFYTLSSPDTEDKI